MKHCLFLVHGMGRHEPDEWKNEIWERLIELSKQYKYFATRDLEDLVEPVAINYDHLIQNVLQKWQDAGEEFASFPATQGLDVSDALSWLEGIADDDAGFFESHLADVVIYRFFKLQRARIQDDVKCQFAKVITERREEDSSAGFSVLAHSLGTAVAHDALAELGGSAEIGGSPNVLRAGNFSLQSIHMLANVSRLLQTKPKAYESVIRPGGRDATGSYCLRMYSHRHELDPIAMPKSFEPFGWPAEYTEQTLKHLREVNLHSYLHYLDNPRVHIPLLTSVTRASAINRFEKYAAVDNYPKYGGDFEAVPAVKQKLGELAVLGTQIRSETGLMENYKTILEMWKKIQELKELLG